MGLSQEEDSSQDDVLSERPLYVWLKSFAGREIDEKAPLPDYVTSNALSYALEYIGITSEGEQSSLHLSAIFDEDGQSQFKNKYPTHFESETKSRIQNLNRVFIELKSYFEDHYSQIVAIRPPNSVHISSACGQCSVKEFEKLLFLILGAAIQGNQKQDTIQKIKRFPPKVQESLIECIKLIADNPDLVNVKLWQEFITLEQEEQKKIYESLLSLIRKLILERNESMQNQLLMDYFAGYMNCDQKRVYESRGCSVYADLEKNSDDARLSSSMRLLREQLLEKSELLQECREELQEAKNRMQELESEVHITQQKLRAMKKARDELDALREGQDKASRMEAELQKMKSKLQETEQIYERVETLEIENRNLQLKHDMLLDQISFLSLDKSSDSFSYLDDGITPSFGNRKHTIRDQDTNFFESDDDEPSVKENPNSSKSLEGEFENCQEIPKDEGLLSQSSSTLQADTSPEKDDIIIERPTSLDISQTESIDGHDNNIVASTPKSQVEQKSQEVQTPTQSRIKRRRRSSLLNVKRTRRAIVIPITGGQKLPLGDLDKLADNSPLKNNSSPTIQLFKVYNMDRRKGSTRPKKFKSPTKEQSEDKQVVPNVDIGNDADEELSLSPTGVPNESDLDSNNENNNGTDNDSEIYFVCSPQHSNSTGGTSTPRRNHFGTTTAFPISPEESRATRVHHQVNFNTQSVTTHSNHLTLYSRDGDSNPASPTTVQVPLMKISHEVRIGQQSDDTDEGGLHDEDIRNRNNNPFVDFADYNIQLSLRNTSVKPSTALINKISTLSAKLSPDHNYNQYEPHHNYLVETSSEEDGSVWYEYGCV